jgi:hypothetical protein
MRCHTVAQKRLLGCISGVAVVVGRGVRIDAGPRERADRWRSSGGGGGSGSIIVVFEHTRVVGTHVAPAADATLPCERKCIAYVLVSSASGWARVRPRWAPTGDCNGRRSTTTKTAFAHRLGRLTPSAARPSRRPTLPYSYDLKKCGQRLNRAHIRDI